MYIERNFEDNVWAIVTGGSDGIGKSFVYKLKDLGYNVFLISKDSEKLLEFEKFSNIKIYKVDFRNLDIYNELENSLKSLNVKILINNVGMLNKPNYLHKISFEEIKDLIICNIFSYVNVTKIFINNNFEKNKNIKILNISSISSKLPFPFYSVYSGTKSFIDKFAEDVKTEYNIDVNTLNPYFVSTKMSKVKPSLFTPSANDYVNSICKNGTYVPHDIIYYFVNIINFLIPNFLRSYMKSKFIKFINEK